MTKSQSLVAAFGLLLVGAGMILTGCDDDKNKTLVVGTSADYPPFEFYKDGKIVGFEIDLITQIAEKLGKKITVKDMGFESIIGSLQSKRIDLSISAISETEERKLTVDFSVPYHQSQTVILTDKDAKIKKPEDLANTTIGVQMGTSYEPMIKKDWQPKIANLNVRSLSKIHELLQDFKSKRIVAIILGVSEAQKIIEKHPHMKIIPVDKTEVFYAIAFPKGSPLKDQVNKILKQMKDDGTIKALEQKWQSVD